MKRLDKQSVLALELKAPGACQKVARGLYGRVHGGEILSAFSQSERELIWSKICSATTERLIPSLRGFFNDINYIKLAADCMKRLVSLTSDKNHPSGAGGCIFGGRSKLRRIPGPSF